MLYHLALDTNRIASPHLYDSRTKTYTRVHFEGARSFLEEYINKMKLQPISIYESQLPDRIQLICWYTIKPSPETRLALRTTRHDPIR